MAVYRSESFPFIGDFLLNIGFDEGIPKDLPWGTVSSSENLTHTFNILLLKKFNEMLSSSISSEEISIALGTIYPNAIHQPYRRYVSDENRLLDNEGIPLPVRFYAPIDGPMVFKIDEDHFLVNPGDIIAVKIMSKVSFYPMGNESENPTRFFIIDTPPFENGIDYDVT